MALTVGISIVSMNRPHVLAHTVERLRSFNLNSAPVVVVDNGSTNAATLFLLDTCERAGWRVIRNTENRGLSHAVNQGLGALETDVMLHLDDDAVVVGPLDWLSRLLSPFSDHPELGLAVPMVSQESIPCGGYAEVRWGLGFIWAIRRETYVLTGGYDSQLYHQQECDLAVRVRMAGYTVGAVPNIQVRHNDPGGPRSPLTLAREHIGVVQFRDKWTGYYRGLGWNYGTFPVYLMQHWPTDQDFLERFAKAHGMELNPLPTLEGNIVFGLEQVVTVNGRRYFKRYALVEDGEHWETMEGAHHRDRELAIERWKELTGEHYEGYKWPGAPLFKVRDDT